MIFQIKFSAWNINRFGNLDKDFKWVWAGLNSKIVIRFRLENCILGGYMQYYHPISASIYVGWKKKRWPNNFQLEGRSRVLSQRYWWFVKSIKAMIDGVPRFTSQNGLPLANIAWSPTMENASGGVHSAVIWKG